MWLFGVACFQLLLIGHILDGLPHTIHNPRFTGVRTRFEGNLIQSGIPSYMKKNEREEEFEYLFSTLEPKWFRKRYLDFKPGGVISSTTREGVVDDGKEEDATDPFVSPLNKVSSTVLKPTPNIRKLAIFPFIDGQAFPTGVFPMNIFVMKYRMMINDVYSNPEKIFGIVYSDSSDGFCSFGTSVEIQERDMQSDGRQVLFTVCRSRFKILRILQEEPYMICEVDYDVPDLDVFLAQKGTPPPPVIPRKSVSGAGKVYTDKEDEKEVGKEVAEEVPVQGELSPYLCQLEREVYQALCDVIALANKKKLGGAEATVTQPVLDLSPDKHPFRLSVASAFSFAISDMLGCDPKLKQLLLESPTLELRLRRLRALLVGTRDFLYEQLLEEEPFG